MIKKDPIYKITVYTQDKTITITSPITCQMQISRSVHTTACNATVQLYNLAASTREYIFQDVFTFDKTKWKYLQVEAGYNGLMSQLFMGRILQAYSHKQGGATDIITEIQAQALDLLDCDTSHTFEAGTDYKEIYNTIAKDLPNCIIGNTGALEGAIRSATTFDGNAFDELNKLSGGNTFIDNGVINTIMNNECIDVPVPVISDDAGLLETPMRRDASLFIKSIFIPELIIGQLLEIKSGLFTNFNGQYKVMGFTHSCLFSPTRAGSRITEVELWIGPLLPGSVITTTDNKVENNFNKVKNDKISPVETSVPGNVRELYKIIKQNNGIVPNVMMTKNINWRDLLVNNNSPSDVMKDLTLEIMANVYQIGVYFQSVLDKYFAGHTVKFNSGFRTVQNNKQCKGAANSKHLKGLAIDFNINGVPLIKQVNIFRNVWNGKIIPYNTFIHVQLGNSQGRTNDK